MRKLFIIPIAIGLSSCAVPTQPPPSGGGVASIQGGKYWTLDFFHFYKGKQTHTETRQFVNRRDCFDAMYQMREDEKKEAFHTGSGICMKRFVAGQKRTQDDFLGYR